MRRRARVGLACGLLSVLLHIACTGGGQIELAQLEFRAIDPPPPTISRFSVQECYWWTDAQEHLWIAARHRAIVPPLPQLLQNRLEFYVMLRLEKLPSGREREYSLRTQELRGLVRAGPIEIRFSSQIGIAAVYREPGEALRLSARAQVGGEVKQLFGWSPPRRSLMLLARRAAPDRGAGRAWVALTDAPGWERQAGGGPTSRPGVR